MLINPTPTTENLGGKGYQLSLLNGFFSVPEFFVIHFNDANEIGTDVVQEEIMKVFYAHKFNFVSVRSSATVEDSNVASFAGMFQTKLNVTCNNLICSIKEVIESVNNERVVEYCKLNELDVGSVKVRIIVQRMVNCKVSGVCITKDISNPNVMLIEACWGVGEVLVSGLITPDTYKVNRNDYKIESISIGFQKKMVLPFKNDEVQDVPFHLRNAKKLKEDELLELSRTCLSIEDKLNYQIADIEWAFEKDKLYILQARPFVGKL